MCRAAVNNAGANYDSDAFGEMVTYLDLVPLPLRWMVGRFLEYRESEW